MAQTLVPPSGVSPGATVIYIDGTEGVIAADGTISVPDYTVSYLLNAGFNFAASDPGQQSSAVSSLATAVGTASSAGSNATASVATVSSSASVNTVSVALVSSSASTANTSAAMNSSVASLLTLSEAVSSSVASRVKSSFSW